MTTESNTREAKCTAQWTVNRAMLHLNTSAEMATSAQACLSDADRLMNAGEYRFAAVRALRSLAYSLGIFHPVYKETEQLISTL